jgi:hypothetical protein
VEHLYYEVCRRRRRRRVPWVGAVIVFAAAFFLGIQSGSGLIGFAVAVVAEGVFVWLMRRRGPAPLVQLSLDAFNAMWDRWLKVHGAPKSVIARKSPAPTPKKKAEPDLADYSFDRAVICDRARTVDLLVANNFHFENNCAVLAVGGYPPGPFETIRTMLRRNPRLRVFALHDATPAGCRLAHQLATNPEWFKDLPAVTDVGLRPSHAGPFAGLLLPVAAGAVAAGDGITASEAGWLARHALELAAIRPEQVLKRLFRAINRTSDDDDNDGDGGTTASGTSARVDQDSDAFAADAGDADGGADAFG